MRSVIVPGAGGPTNEDRTVNNSDDDLRQAIALFRYGVIADLVHLPLGTPGIGDKLRDKASQPYTIPGSERTHVAANTIRGWIRLYRYGGFEALYPKPRTDRGQPRRLPPEVAERLIALKVDNPAWSVRAVIKAAREGGVDHPLAPSTVHRLFSRGGLFDKKPPDGADRRRFAFRDAGELWMSDIMHGPKVRLGRSRRKTYLIAFIDDATRVIPFAAFATAENIQAFLPVFKNALIRRGLPQRLYVDNGAACRSRQLVLICAKLGVALVHARPYQPAGKGKIERYFRTLRAGWLNHLDAQALDSLQTLNRSLWAWIEGEYHNTPHRGIEGRTPLEQWALASAAVRYPDASDETAARIRDFLHELGDAFYETRRRCRNQVRQSDQALLPARLPATPRRRGTAAALPGVGYPVLNHRHARAPWAGANHGITTADCRPGRPKSYIPTSLAKRSPRAFIRRAENTSSKTVPRSGKAKIM